jgi:hypothetical protein
MPQGLPAGLLAATWLAATWLTTARLAAALFLAFFLFVTIALLAAATLLAAAWLAATGLAALSDIRIALCFHNSFLLVYLSVFALRDETFTFSVIVSERPFGLENSSALARAVPCHH